MNTRAGDLTIERIPSATAFGEWDKRRRAFSATNQWPIILGPEALDEDLADAVIEETPGQVLHEASQIGFEAFVEQRLEVMREDYGELDLDVDVSALDLNASGSAEVVAIQGFGDAPPPPNVSLVEVPCSAPWQVLSALPFGGWNDVPSDAALTAAFHSWHDRFGAVPIAVTRDTVEFWLDQPVTDPQAAAKLAVEMYAVCADAVDQGTESVHALAQCILNSNVWFFWWD